MSMDYQNRGFLQGFPTITKNLIIINILAWLASIILPKVGINLTELCGLHYFESIRFKPHQLITYMFLHDTHSPAHIFFNMFAVFMFGSVLENYWGQKRYLIFYMLTGIGAALVQECTWYFDLRDLMNSGYQTVSDGITTITVSEYLNLYVTVGASGAVFGLLLAFGMLFPDIPLFIMFIPIPVKAKYIVIGYGVAELFLGVANFKGDNIAHFAHLGGMIFGFILIKYWQKKKNDGFRIR